MGLLELTAIISMAVALYNVQQIKITLKIKGYPVEPFSGWLRDYKQFKSLISKERDQTARVKYQKILNGLYFSLAGLVVLIVIIVKERM